MVVLNVVNTLMIDHTIHHRLSREESSIHEQVTKETSCNEEKLISPNLGHLGHLSSTTLLDVLLDFLRGFIFESDCCLFFIFEFFINLICSLEQVLILDNIVLSILDFGFTFALR